MENIYWKKTVDTLVKSIWIYTLAGIVGGIMETIDSPLGAVGDLISSAANGEDPIGFLDVVCWACSLAVIYGYYLFFKSIVYFVKLQNNDLDRQNADKIRQSYIFLVIAIVVDFIPLIGGLGKLVLLIISYVKLIGGYTGLRDSAVLPQGVKEGAAGLRKATIWLLVAVVIGKIPLVGGVVETVINLIMFFSILKSWKLIGASAPEISDEEAARCSREIPMK